MIFYKNLKKHKQTEKKDLIFSIFEDGMVLDKDDSVAKPAECKNLYNLSYCDGALKTGLGFRDLQVPANTTDLEDCHGFNFASKMDEIDGIWTQRIFSSSKNEYSYVLLLIDSSFQIWRAQLIDDLMGFVAKRSSLLDSYPTFQCNYRIENEDGIAFFSNEKMVYFTSNSEGYYDNVPAMISCCVHYDKFFGVTNKNRNTLVYTSNLNLKDWQEEESATIEFLDNRGMFTKLVAFNDYVYLFREYGITKISLYSSKSDFSFTHLYTSPSKIFENSVCVCGDLVFFATRDGLYTFNGNSVSKVEQNYSKLFENLDNTNCSSACLDGKYYLATKCKFFDGEKVGCEESEHVNNVLFEIDINDFSLNVLRGIDIRKVLAVDNPYMSKLCACFYGENKQRVGELTKTGETFEKVNEKSWESFKTDLGFPAKRKRIKEIFLTTKFDCAVKIESDEETKTFNFSGDEKQQRLPINLCGKDFQFCFSTTNAQCDIKKPKIVFDVEK